MGHFAIVCRGRLFSPAYNDPHQVAFRSCGRNSLPVRQLSPRAAPIQATAEGVVTTYLVVHNATYTALAVEDARVGALNPEDRADESRQAFSR